MATTTVTNISYSGTIQNATVTGEFGIPVNAYLWGAGGGSAREAGNAGGYSKVYFVAKPGDILTVAVGQGGGRGGENINPWTPSGFPGASYSGLLFNTRFPPIGQDYPVFPYGQGARNTTSNFTSFLSQWGVWGPDQNVQTFTRQYLVNFPTTENVIFQMVASTMGRVYLDSNLIVSGGGRSVSGSSNDTINQAFVRVTAGTHVITIEADGSGQPANPVSGNPNAIGVIFGTGDQTTYSGGRGGQVDNPDSYQGAAGGGGGATILSLNGVIIGVAAGGAGGASRPAGGVSYVTTNYAGSTATQPFGAPGLSGWPSSWAPVVIAPGTSGWYEQSYTYTIVESGATFNGPVVSYCVVINGTIVYGPSGSPPPAATFQKKNFAGYSYSVYQPGGGTDYTFFTACYDFDYTSLNVNGSTDFRYNNGQDGQDIAGFQTIYGSQAGGGGGGGGGLWAGQGGTAGGGNPTAGGTAGINGTSLGDDKSHPVRRFPYVNSFYPGNNVAVGGQGGNIPTSGGNGFIALEYQTGGGGYVNDGGTWKPVQTTYIKHEGSWTPVQTTYINIDGIWKPIQGVPVPAFAPFYGAFAPSTRNFGSRVTPPPPPPAPDYGGGFSGYGSSDMF
jgi:hypothetical protein